jgi:tRNA (cytidine32/guanosine34-2'-O)-methyltransferase
MLRYTPNMQNPLLDQKYSIYDELEGPARLIAPFVACGDLNTAYDSDKTYPLVIDGREYNFCSPITAPINPPYQRAKQMRQSNLIGRQQPTDLDENNSSRFSDLTISN